MVNGKNTTTEIILFAVIFCFLFWQFYYTRTSYSKTYPAIVLPSGEQVVKNNKIYYINFIVEAFSADNKVKRIDLKKLLDNIPARYRIRVIRNHFGLPISTLNKPSVQNSKRIKEGEKWLLKRIERLTGFSSIRYIKVLRYTNSKTIKAGNKITTIKNTSSYTIPF